MTDDTIPVIIPVALLAKHEQRKWESFDHGDSWVLLTTDWTVRRSPTGNWLVCQGGETIDAYPLRADAQHRAEYLAGVAA